MQKQNIVNLFFTLPHNLEIWNLLNISFEKGAHINSKTKYNKTLLHFASESGNLELVKIFIENGADINAKTNDGETPLHFATESRNFNL